LSQAPSTTKVIPQRDLVEEKQAGTKLWKRLPLGVVTLAEGEVDLTIHALSKPGEWVMEVKAVEFSPRGAFE